MFADARLQPRWVAEAFASVARSDCAEIVAIGIARLRRGASSHCGRKAYCGLDQWAFGADGSEPVDLVARAARRAGRSRRRSRNLLELDLDVAFALGDIDETPLDGVARLGVWRFQVDGAAEVAAGEPLTGSALAVRLAPGRDAAPRLPVLGAHRSVLGVAQPRARCCRRPREFPLRALREAQRSGREWLEQRPLRAEIRDRPRFPDRRSKNVVCP